MSDGTRRADMDCATVRDLAPLFVTGALEPTEAAAIREHLAGCEDPHLELLELGEAATAMLETVEPVEPPAGLKSRLMAAAEADLREGRHPSLAPGARRTTEGDAGLGAGRGAGVAARGGVTRPAAHGELIDLARERAVRRPRLSWLVAVAAVIVAVALGGWNVALRGQLDDREAYRAGVDATLALAAEPGSLTAVLAGPGGAPAGLAAVGADGRVRLALLGLAPTGGTQVYAAWGIAGEAAPVLLGDVRVRADGTGTGSGASPVVRPGMVVALTLEPRGGAASPTLPIVASGVAGAPAG